MTNFITDYSYIYIYIYIYMNWKSAEVFCYMLDSSYLSGIRDFDVSKITIINNLSNYIYI